MFRSDFNDIEKPNGKLKHAESVLVIDWEIIGKPKNWYIRESIHNWELDKVEHPVHGSFRQTEEVAGGYYSIEFDFRLDFGVWIMKYSLPHTPTPYTKFYANEWIQIIFYLHWFRSCFIHSKYNCLNESSLDTPLRLTNITQNVSIHRTHHTHRTGELFSMEYAAYDISNRLNYEFCRINSNYECCVVTHNMIKLLLRYKFFDFRNSNRNIRSNV